MKTFARKGKICEAGHKNVMAYGGCRVILLYLCGINVVRGFGMGFWCGLRFYVRECMKISMTQGH